MNSAKYNLKIHCKKMKTINLFWSILVCICSFSCGSDDEGNANNNDLNDYTICDFMTIESANLYENAPNDDLIINSITLIDDCMIFEFSAGGCDGSTWEVQLIDSGQILESFPIQRNLRLSLNNQEDCEAFVTKSLSFDIANLQDDGNNQVVFNVDNFESQVLYEY